MVGVAADITFDGITERTPMQLDVPLAQEPAADFSLVVRTTVDPASISTALSEAVAGVNRDIPVTDVRTMDHVLGQSIARQGMARLVLSVFALLAVAVLARAIPAYRASRAAISTALCTE